MRRKSLLVLVSAVLVSVAGYTAVGASAKDSAKSPIIMFNDIALTSTIQVYPEVSAGVKAAARAINKTGGVNGHPIKIITCDTQYELNAALACARKASTDHAVVDVQSNNGTFNPQTVPAYQQEKIAQVGVRASALEFVNPNMYPIEGGDPSVDIGAAFAMKALGSKVMGGFVRDVATGIGSVAIVQRAAKVAGLKWSGTVIFPTGTTDFTPYALKLRESGADSVFFSTGFAQTLPMMRAMQSIGYQPKIVTLGGVLGTPEFQQLGSLGDGVVVTQTMPQATDTRFAGVKKYNADMTAAGYAASNTTLRKAFSIQGWLSVYAAAAIAKQIKGPITNLTFLAQLKKSKPITLFDLVTWNPRKKGPAAFPRMTSSRVYSYVGKGGAFVADPLLKPIDALTAMHLQ